MSVGTLDPARILKELGQLWTETGGEAQENTGAAVLRACSMTLLVLTRERSDLGLGETLSELMRDHPARVILIRETDGAEPSLDARVSAQCWLPFGQRRHICSEQVEVTAAPSSMPELPPVVRALRAADLPTVLWCDDPELLAGGAAGILELADKLILDSGGCGDPAAALDLLLSWKRSGHVVADLSWARLTRWREAIAQLFASAGRQAQLEDIEDVTVTHHGERAPAQALYLAAWLRNTIGELAQHRLEPAEGVTVEITGAELDLRIEQAEGEAAADHELLREELSIGGRDLVFERALETASRLAQGMR